MNSATELVLWEISGQSEMATQIKDLREKISRIIKEVQQTTIHLHNRLSSSESPVQKQLNMFMNYDWDFDHYLEEDVPAVVR